mmetsp:Transcript_126088/g.217650  ORF Transcript_126088/g.217650 Transcript_126088/m.217650 type:complete len:135 (+) Transcript_126088:3-407(+)
MNVKTKGLVTPQKQHDGKTEVLVTTLPDLHVGPGPGRASDSQEAQCDCRNEDANVAAMMRMSQLCLMLTQPTENDLTSHKLLCLVRVQVWSQVAETTAPEEPVAAPNCSSLCSPCLRRASSPQSAASAPSGNFC